MRFVEKDCHFCAVLIFYRLNEVISEEKEELELETQATEKASQTSRKPLISPEPRLPEVVVPKISKTGALKSKTKTKTKPETWDMGHGTDQYCRQKVFRDRAGEGAERKARIGIEEVFLKFTRY